MIIYIIIYNDIIIDTDYNVWVKSVRDTVKTSIR